MKNSSPEYEIEVARLKLEYDIKIAAKKMMVEKSLDDDRNWYK